MPAMGLYVLIGIVAGIVSGFFGVGGGTILVPAFVLFLGMSQHAAQGTALAVMLPPVFILAVWPYYQKGLVDLKVTAVVIVAFTVGALLGGLGAQGVPDVLLRRGFGVLLVILGIKMML